MSGRLERLALSLRRSLGKDPARGAGIDALLQRMAPVVARFGAGLDLLAALHGTDKFGAHDYTPVYEALMREARRKPVRLLEIGVGGYASALGGASLRMWASYFPRGHIFGIDAIDKTELSGGRIQVFHCSQVDAPRLGELARAHGPFDFIIDDGSHMNAHQIETFGILWPHVKDGGTYIVEDVQTSYWPSYGGGAIGTPAYAQSCMQWFKNLADSVNLCEFLDPAAPGLDATLASIAFHHNLVVLRRDFAERYTVASLDNPEVRARLLQAPD